jgi:DNA-binding transcriptional regulator GbsR (MarR family)
MVEKEIENKILSLFSRITSSLGYSQVHGKIIGILMIEGKPLSLQEISKRTRYSLGSISLSLDLLEFFGIIKKFKKSGERKVFVKLTGDLLIGLKNVVIFKIEKNAEDVINELEYYKKRVRDKKTLKAIKVLEKETKRLKKYIEKISSVKIPNH